MIDTPQPTPEQIAETLHFEGDALGLKQVAGYDLVRSWERDRSGTSFYRFRVDPDGREILVKTGDDWAVDDASSFCRAQASLAGIISAADIDHTGVVEPYGYTRTPPLLVMPYVDGTDLVTLLREPKRPEWKRMTAWIGAAGEMLAEFHHANLPQPESDLSVAVDEVAGAARRMRVRQDRVNRLLDRVEWRTRCVMAYGDFGPGNLLGVEDGDVYLIDPPTELALALAHRDLGNFLFETRRQLAGRGYTRSKPVPGRFEELRRAFLDGYSSRSRQGPLGPADEGVIALFEMRRAAGMVRKRLPARPGDAAWFLGSALARRQEVARSLAQSE